MRTRLGPLARRGPWPVIVMSSGAFPGASAISDLLEAAQSDAVLILQRVLPAPTDLRRLRSRYGRIIFDFDDAIFATPRDPESPPWLERGKRFARLLVRGSTRASARKRPLQQVLRGVDLCVVGNAYLGRFAARHCARVIEIPTTADPLPVLPAHRSHPTVVWIGVAANLQYLDLIAEPVARAWGSSKFRFVVVSSRPWAGAPIPAEFVPWSVPAEREALTRATIGLAPLIDDPWTRGKCAYRSVVYGAHGLATVASPVGVTPQVVVHGQTGLLARTDDEWTAAIARLARSPDYARQMGRQAWERIRAAYCDDVALRLWSQVIADRGVIEAPS
jgi:hypothetical protein